MGLGRGISFPGREPSLSFARVCVRLWNTSPLQLCIISAKLLKKFDRISNSRFLHLFRFNGYFSLDINVLQIECFLNPRCLSLGQI